MEAVQAAMQGQAAVMQASLLHLLDHWQQETQPADAAVPAPSVLQGSKSVDAGFVGSMVQLLQALGVFACA